MSNPKTTAVKYIGSLATCTVNVGPGQHAEFSRGGPAVEVPADAAKQMVAGGDFTTGSKPAKPRKPRKPPAKKAAATTPVPEPAPAEPTPTDAAAGGQTKE